MQQSILYRPKNPEPLPGRLLEPLLAQLESHTDLETAPRDVLEEIINLLDNRCSIDGTGNNYAGATMYTDFCGKWEVYLDRHPEVKERVDPHYVLVGENPSPNDFDDAVQAYLPGVRFNGIPLVPVHNTDWCWAFPQNQMGRDHAHHFLGHMRNAIPGLNMWMISTPGVFVVY